jgi:hypothetical protein
MGGEAVARKILTALGKSETQPGYADIIVNSSYVGGQVLQAGNFTFSRIFDAGHTVPSYQPETAFTVFTRIIEGTDIGMGKEVDLATFSSQGPSRSVHPLGKQRKVPEQEPHTCWIRNIEYTCSVKERAQINRGEGVIRNGIWYAQAHDYRPQSNVAHAGKPGSLPPTPLTAASATTSTIPLTGVYTASETPTPTSGAILLRSPFRVQRRQIVAPLAAPAPAVVTQVVYPDSARERNTRKKSKKLSKALIATAATLGSLLLL